METKACSLTEDEISELISTYGMKLGARSWSDIDIERINYLNRRLKAFKEEAPKLEQTQAEVKTEPVKDGW